MSEDGAIMNLFYLPSIETILEFKLEGLKEPLTEAPPLSVPINQEED